MSELMAATVVFWVPLLVVVLLNAVVQPLIRLWDRDAHGPGGSHDSPSDEE